MPHGAEPRGARHPETLDRTGYELTFDEDFVAPDATSLEGVSTTVPSTGGMSVDQARQVLENAGFNTSVGGTVNSNYAEGTVAYTSPGSGSSAPSGSVITIYQSSGFVPAAPTETFASSRSPRPSG